MKTQVFKSKEECLEHYLKLQGKTLNFTEDEVKDFLNTTVRTKEEIEAGLPTYAIISRAATWFACSEVYAEVYFPELEEKNVSSIYVLTFKEQKDGTYNGDVPDFLE
jgi:hypothetical protein